ncbi:hypothetical protein [Halocella sp. SP3-1]|uniref:hypothetical protein n=1 Tax=Halocella sp. SP3-1 TaxID=2382161 RepID=UPI000F74E44A|nr:hypothetical protein [Halocella sp. SP3-1]AZO95113.1 hypothetical protein D7D81_11235 [Halocella sp. SP3-1]
MVELQNKIIEDIKYILNFNLDKSDKLNINEKNNKTLKELTNIQTNLLFGGLELVDITNETKKNN